uniref:T cell receptor associated transmembrane adaptor 1 n=1 Tax=Pelusios castaneus TaxID=367368 RepID=A0A8C8VDZ4_9SAUR
MEPVSCHFAIWGLLAFVSMALVVSLVINISYCIANKQKGKKLCVFLKVCKNLTLEECCYEQMKAQPPRLANEVKVLLFIFLILVVTEVQMCYASLDHSIKEKHRKPRKKKAPSLEVNEEEIPSKTSTMASQLSIYLNSHELSAENQPAEEAIHDDPMRLAGYLHIYPLLKELWELSISQDLALI